MRNGVVDDIDDTLYVAIVLASELLLVVVTRDLLRLIEIRGLAFVLSLIAFRLLLALKDML